MFIFKTIAELKNHLNSIHTNNKTVGFVPTMGALHQGHAFLVKQAKQNSDTVVSSIFVNPTQFNDPKDLEKYPRTLQKDCTLLESVGCDIVFVPEVNEIYSEKELELKNQNIEDDSWSEGKNIDFGILDKVMEGAHRPGHFNGVAQIVSKLFKIVEPNKAFFGQKDFQQLAIIKSMVQQMDFKIEIISCSTIREKDGLAMSSRNIRLTKEERRIAPLIYKTLSSVKEMAKNNSPSELIKFAKTQLEKENQMQLEYFDIVDTLTLQPLTSFNNKQNAVACVALKLGNVRLIDNILL